VIRILVLSALLLGAAAPRVLAGAPVQEAAQVLPGPGAKVPLGREHYFTYGFVDPPKLGMAVMKVSIFERSGKPETDFSVTGDADMPSMRGAHSTGPRGFSRSKKGTYLLPVSLVMPGTWELRLTFVKDGRSVLCGVYRFDL
jgi:hypothetical protein